MPVLHKSEQALRSLARAHGIQVTYRDGMGTRREVPGQTLQVLLTAMGIHCHSDEDVRREIRKARARKNTRWLDCVYVVWENDSERSWWINLPLSEGMIDQAHLTWDLVDEEGRQKRFERSGGECSIIERRRVQGQPYVRLSIPILETCPRGYYQLIVSVTGIPASLTGEALLIVAPHRCFRPERKVRAWGLTAQLYGLRSSTNWGIGDFRDVTTLAEWAGPECGVETIGLNPLHALSDSIVSPYSPSSRLFHNPLYLNIEAIEEYQAETIQEKVGHPDFQDRLRQLRESETVDYSAVRKIKREMLEALYEVFVETQVKNGTAQAAAFDQFLEAQGPSLEGYAVFQVLQEHHQGKGWKEWSTPFQSPDSPETMEFADQHRKRVRYYQYLEWQCDQQLKSLSQTMVRTGITLGLYQDLAIGIHPDGADAWMFRPQLAEGVEVGAPPDAFNLSGQTWGLQPPLPNQLRESGYRFIRDTFRHNMEDGGMLRIDHALGLFRLYWVPTGRSGSEGAYVKYHTEELLAILALESVRHRVIVVGEDLGTVTPAIRKRLSSAGLLSYRLLMFERSRQGGYRSPSQFPEQALVSVNTHDLPTLRGFWVERDIDVKERVGLYPSGKEAGQERVSRVLDRKAILQALRNEDLLPEGCDQSVEGLEVWRKELGPALYAYLARSPSWVVAISLEDLLGEVETPNVPGAPDHAYPVWRRKLGRYLEDMTHDQQLRDFSSTINRERGSAFPHGSRE